MKIIERRVKLPEYLKRDSDKFNQIIAEYCDQNQEKLNYKNFVEDLRGFDYEAATFQRVTGAPSLKSAHSQGSSLHSDMLGIPGKRPTSIFDDEYVVLDA